MQQGTQGWIVAGCTVPGATAFPRVLIPCFWADVISTQSPQGEEKPLGSEASSTASATEMSGDTSAPRSMDQETLLETDYPSTASAPGRGPQVLCGDHASLGSPCCHGPDVPLKSTR